MLKMLNTAVFVCLGFAGLFLLEQGVRSLEREKRQLTIALEKNLDTLRILKAEWSYLNSPPRLAELNRRHLRLKPLTTSQIVSEERLAILLPIPKEEPKGEEK